MAQYRPVAALLAVALLLPSALAQGDGLGLGGLAPAAAPVSAGGITQNVAVPTQLCEREFCLQGAPAACGGDCVLTPLGNSTRFCATTCIASWNSAATQSCLADKATGVYIQSVLTALANRCNAGAIAAARRKAAQAKYNTLFPCTKTVNATTLLGLDTCPTGANATATNCPAQCSGALLDIPTACRNTFSRLSAPWNATLTACVTAAGPSGSPAAVGSGVGSGNTNFLGGPVAAEASPSSQAAFPQATPTAALAAALFGALILGAAMY